MGKNIQHGNLVQRSGNLAFYNVPTGHYTTGIAGTLTRMEGFTDLGRSHNPKEYSRQYVDEDFERTDIISYSTAISYAFDLYKGNSVLEDIVDITERELIGDKMKRQILTVDMTTCVGSGTGTETAFGRIRQYSVIPDSSGNTKDCMTYTGNFKANGESRPCSVTSKDGWQTIDSISYDVGVTSINTVIELSLDNGETVPLEGGVGRVYTATVPRGSSVTFKVTADGSSGISVSSDSGTSMGQAYSGASPFTKSGFQITNGANRFVIIVSGANISEAYVVNVTGE